MRILNVLEDFVELLHVAPDEQEQEAERKNGEQSNKHIEPEHHNKAQECCCNSTGEMENRHADHHADVRYIVHYPGDEIAPMVVSEEAVRERHQVYIEIASQLIFYFTRAVQNFHARSISEDGGSEGECAGECDNLQQAYSGAPLQTVYGVFNEERYCGGAEGGEYEGYYAPAELASIFSDVR